MNVCPTAESVSSVLPTLLPLIQVLRDSKWSTHAKQQSGCIISEARIPSLPLKVFRMALEMQCSLATFVYVAGHEHTLRVYDSTLDRCEIIDEPPLSLPNSCDSRRKGGSILYTSYTSQSRFVAPRDFCVRSVGVYLTQAEACELGITTAAAAESNAPEHGMSIPTEGQGNSEAAFYLQNSTSCDCPQRAPQCNGTNMIRGTIHVFGYVVQKLPSHSSSLHEEVAAAGSGGCDRIRVENICCVDAGGSIPKWVMSAATVMNCAKLDTLRALAESQHAALPALRVVVNEDPNIPLAVRREQDVQHSHPLGERAISATLEVNKRGVAICETTPREENKGNFLAESLPVVDYLRDRLVLGSSLDTRQLGTTYANAQTGHEDQVHSLLSQKVLSGSIPYSLSTMQEPLPSPPRLSRRSYVSEAMVSKLGALARQPGWRPMANVSRAQELTSLPYAYFPRDHPPRDSPPLRALRVCTEMRCSLHHFARMLIDSQAASHTDPSLLSVRCSPVNRGEREEEQEQEEVRQLLHYAHGSRSCNAITAAWNRHCCPPWDMAVRCAGTWRDAGAGAADGFFAPSMPAAAYVWVGEDASHEVICDPHERHRRAIVHAFGIVAVAIPADYTTFIRVWHYAVVDYCGAPTGNSHLTLTKMQYTSMLQGHAEDMSRRLAALKKACEDPNWLLMQSAPLRLRPLTTAGTAAVESAEPLVALLYKLEAEFMTLEHDKSPSLLRCVNWRGSNVSCTAFTPSGSTRFIYALTLEVPRRVADVALHLKQNPPCGPCFLPDHIDKSGRDALLLGRFPKDVCTIRHVKYTTACACFASMLFRYMEAFDEDRNSASFALSRINCHVHSGAAAASGSSQRPFCGTVYYDGYVARARRNREAEGETSTTTVVTRYISVDAVPAVEMAMLHEPLSNPFVEEQVCLLLKLFSN